MNNMIFNGVINGKTFNNIEDYNNKIKELLEKGEPFNAYTSTRAIENTPKQNPDEIFEIPFIKDDGLIDFDELHQCKNVGAIKAKLEPLFSQNIKALATFDEIDMSNLLADLNKIENIIQNTYKTNSDNITKITNEYSDKLYNIFQDNVSISIVLFYIKLFIDYIKNDTSNTNKPTEESIKEMSESFDLMTNLFSKLISKTIDSIDNNDIASLGNLARNINNCSCDTQNACNCGTTETPKTPIEGDTITKMLKDLHII